MSKDKKYLRLMVAKSIKVLAAHLQPNGPSDEVTLNRLSSIFDDPEWTALLQRRRGSMSPNSLKMATAGSELITGGGQGEDPISFHLSTLTVGCVLRQLSCDLENAFKAIASPYTLLFRGAGHDWHDSDAFSLVRSLELLTIRMSKHEHYNVEMLAFHLWCSRGYPKGQAHAQWKEAERILAKYHTGSPVTSETSLFGLAASDTESIAA